MSLAPPVIDVDIESHQVVVGLEQDDVSIAIAAPPDVDADDLWQVLAGAPDSIETVVSMYEGARDD